MYSDSSSNVDSNRRAELSQFEYYYCPLLQLTLSSFAHLDIRTENAENRKALMHKRLCFCEQNVSTNVHVLSKYRAYAKRRKVRI